MFVTQEKILKKIHQDRARGDMKKALRRAVEGLEKFPKDYDLAMEAIQLCFDTGDFKQAVTLIKASVRRHPGSRSQLMAFARETFNTTFNPFLGSFIIETLIRNRDVDEIRGILRVCDQDYRESLIKRSETRSKGATDPSARKTPQYTDNELLLALLYISAGRSAEASAPLSRALASSPQDAQVVGELLLELERDLPDDSRVKFTIGLVSFMLGRPEKADKRFFQCLTLPDPPLEQMKKLLESAEKPSPCHDLLVGEILIRMGSEQEGMAAIERYMETDGQQGALSDGAHGEAFMDRKDRSTLSFDRLRALPDDIFVQGDLAFFAAGIAASLERVKDGVEQLQRLYSGRPDRARETMDWINGSREIEQSAPGQRFLFELALSERDTAAAAGASRLAAEMDPSLASGLISELREAVDAEEGDDPELLGALAELYATMGDSESASKVMRRLEDADDVEKEELFRLTGKILDQCGATLDRVMTAVELALKSSDVSGALPWVSEFFKANPDAHVEFASRLTSAAGEDTGSWRLLSEMVDAIAAETTLTRPFRMLQAKGHISKGEIEKAVFEFDQLIMFDESLRFDLIPVYEKAAAEHPENTTLNLALYQLHLDEEMCDRAAHYLCKALESDPNQIRDVLSRFEGLVAREPGNRAIWEEMLQSALNIRHADLAREILSRATASLPESDAAALSIYGARISAADGRSVESLDHLASALESPSVDLRAVEEQLGKIIRKEPMNAEARYLAGETLLRLAREEEAAAQLEKCLELSPSHSPRVREKLEQLLPMSAQPWLISRILGEISWAEGRPTDAYRYFNSAQKGPAESLGGLNEALGRIHDADPSDSRISSIFARGLALENRYDEAADCLEQLYVRDTESTGRVMEILLEMTEHDPLHYRTNRLTARIWAESGETERSLAPILRMMSAPGVDQKRVLGDIEDFVETHCSRTDFLVMYAGLKARAGMHAHALARFSQALATDHSSAREVLEGVLEVEWPESRSVEASLLSADCMMVLGEPAGAFDELQKVSSPREMMLEAVIGRLEVITGMDDDARYYRYGGKALISCGEAARAEKFVREGAAKLEQEASMSLMMTLAEDLAQHGAGLESARIFREIIDRADDREKIWKRIESSWTDWVDEELSEGVSKIEDCGAGPVEGERLARLALDAGRPGEALEIAERVCLPGAVCAAIRASAYLEMERPFIALAICRSAAGDDLEADGAVELLEIEARASEMIGDNGRAAAAYLGIAGRGGSEQRHMQKAIENYTMMLESEIEGTDRVLVKTGSIGPAVSERTER